MAPLRDPEDLNRALGPVVYETLLLGYSLLVWRNRHNYSRLEHANWASAEGQIALECAQIRCRSLHDFLTGKKSEEGGMSATSDFRYNNAKKSKRTNRPLLDGPPRDRINKRSAHLTWDRIADEIPNYDDNGVENNFPNYGNDIFDEALRFIDWWMKQNSEEDFQFTKPHHEYYWQEYQVVRRSLGGDVDLFSCE